MTHREYCDDGPAGVFHALHLNLSRNSPVEEQPERGVYLASPYAGAGDSKFKRTGFLIRTLKRRERHAPLVSTLGEPCLVTLSPLLHGRSARLAVGAFLVCIFSHAAAADRPLATDTNLPVLNTAQQVLDLGVEFTRHFPHPVCVRGLVTYADHGAGVI